MIQPDELDGPTERFLIDFARTPWTADSRSIALLARCADEPPVAERHFKTYVQTRDEWVTYGGTVAEGLRAIRDEYGMALLDRANRSGLDADYDAFATHNWDVPNVEQAIDEAIAATVRPHPAKLADLIVSICRPTRLAA